MDLEWEWSSAVAEGRLAPTGRSAILDSENSADRPSRLCSGKISLSGEIFRHNNPLADYAPSWAALQLPRNGREDTYLQMQRFCFYAVALFIFAVLLR